MLKTATEHALTIAHFLPELCKKGLSPVVTVLFYLVITIVRGLQLGFKEPLFGMCNVAAKRQSELNQIGHYNTKLWTKTDWTIQTMGSL